MPLAFLTDRALVRVSGPDARHFLHNVVTCNVETLAADGARFGALLAPQGKILFDFLIYAPEPDLFLLDGPLVLVADLLKRLGLYRLRAKVELSILPDAAVAAGWGEGWDLPDGALAFPDPRIPALGSRIVLPAEPEGFADASAYEAHRIGLGIPKGGADFVYGDAFPHETDMDQLGGIDFKKGCYVGQEVVSRMQHRGTARTRSVIARFEHPPEPGSEIFAGEKPVGRMGSSAGTQGIALARLDRVADARAAGLPLKAAGIEVTLHKPDWATFTMEG
ncbi:YgfZ/GcvT domain-containing protein [Aquabacter cavernae]|uniref:CAF17-like 4Fe-4S cluster assembly/insertion protein YgfZ n=1 Tax=Aquabacter cavernae TaxID=2496029 RepID=UPI000F8F05F5|nr:folate-binding protein YgfZ [Aquabacter cavernae]